MVRETAREAHMFRFEKPETPRAALLLFLGNETGAKSGFVSYVSSFLGFDFDPTDVGLQPNFGKKICRSVVWSHNSNPNFEKVPRCPRTLNFESTPQSRSKSIKHLI